MNVLRNNKIKKGYKKYPIRVFFILYYIYMCYSVESSLKTTVLSFFSIIYLLASGIPHFQWLGITLIGWCAMQFEELLLLWGEFPDLG